MEKKEIKKKTKFTFNFDKKKFQFFSKYINILIRVGKKSKVEIGFFKILRLLKKEQDTYLLSDYLTKAINTARPTLALISKKKGSKVYRIPVSISMKREIFQAIQWMVKETCGRKKGPFQALLLEELLNIFDIEGNAIKAQEKLHNIAEKNRIYITRYYLK